MADYECAACGKTFKRSPSTHARNKSGLYYCSRACSNRRQQKALPERTCPQCGKTFYRKPSEINSDNSYCSRVCAAHAKSRAIENLPELRGEPGRAKVCQHCGDTYFPKPYRWAESKFCSHACAAAHRFGKPLPHAKKDIAGDKNPNFRGTNNHVTARKNATKYLGQKCMICGWATHVQAHHIVPRRHGGSNNLDNLIMLCPNHHCMADDGMITIEELQKITHAAIAQLSDHLPRFDPLQPVQPGIFEPIP